jgi:protoporphyrinogen/coproporphyrinogen III oxidase
MLTSSRCYRQALDLGLPLKYPGSLPRYIYYPDHLARLPPHATLSELLTEPLFWEAVPALLGWGMSHLRGAREAQSNLSVAEYVHRVCSGRALGRGLADNMVSAMMHGIHGGDIDKLDGDRILGSMLGSSFPPTVVNGPGGREQKQQHLQALISQDALVLEHFAADPLILREARRKKGSLIHFGEGGMQSLVDALVNALSAQPNVQLKLSEPVRKITYRGGESPVRVSTDHQPIAPSISLRHLLGGGEGFIFTPWFKPLIVWY